MKKKDGNDIEGIIWKAVAAMKVASERSTKDACRATERRLYALTDVDRVFALGSSHLAHCHISFFEPTQSTVYVYSNVKPFLKFFSVICQDSYQVT